jgi:hypothetical protein
MIPASSSGPALGLSRDGCGAVAATAVGRREAKGTRAPARPDVGPDHAGAHRRALAQGPPEVPPRVVLPFGAHHGICRHVDSPRAYDLRDREPHRGSQARGAVVLERAAMPGRMIPGG